MEDLQYEEIKKFIYDFDQLYKNDSYISKKTYDKFIDDHSYVIDYADKKFDEEDHFIKKYRLILNKGYEAIDKRNKQYLEFHLKKDKDYFDNMFKDVDENIVLDEEQRKAILIDEDYSLVVAGAGAGKTTTMAAKVKYLVEKRNIKPSSIILLSFTNKAVEELDSLINDKFKLNVEILTFHKLGMKFLRNSSDKKYDIISDGGIYSILKQYFIENVFRNKELLKRYNTYFNEYLKLEDTCYNFDTYEEYYDDYVAQMYEKDKDNLKEVINKRKGIRSRNFRTIKNELVKSEGEVKIANYLFTHGINYEYERLYDYKLIDNRTYKPDFTIGSGEDLVYVEYYGPTTLLKNGSYHSELDNYDLTIEKKRKTHKKNNTDLIELFGRYEDSNDYYLKKLSYELSQRNFKKDKITDEEIYKELLYSGSDFKFMNLIFLIRAVINNYKQKFYSIYDFDDVIQKCDDEIVKNQLLLIKNVYLYYENEIKIKNRIDFNDMINDAYRNVNIIKSERPYLNYDYVIVDEYQDISHQRYNFIKRISDLFDAKIVAVGDDWQTIYSFSGSDIDLFEEFNVMMGYSEQITIVNTYRNSQELIDLAGEFVLKNKKQIEKKLHSNKHLYKPVKIIEYDYDETNSKLPERLEKLIAEIYSDHQNDNILLLARFNDELNNLLSSGLFYKKTLKESTITCKSIPDARIDFLTIHKSKGLGYDRVIVLNGIDATKGLPSKIADPDIIRYIKGGNSFSKYDEFIEYPEERRLFYVALTRTKNELYIMTPSKYQYRSEFVKEIEDNENVSIIE